MPVRYSAAKSRRQYTFDKLLLMKDAGAVTASGAGTVGGTAKVLDVGTGLFDADLVIDISAIENAGAQSYTIAVQGSTMPDFSSNTARLGTTTVGGANVAGNDAASNPGRYIVGSTNEMNNTYYRYLRIYVTVAGTITTGINFTAFFGVDNT